MLKKRDKFDQHFRRGHKAPGQLLTPDKTGAGLSPMPRWDVASRIKSKFVKMDV